MQPGENSNRGGKTRSAHCRLHGPASLRYLERILGPDHPSIKHQLQSYRRAPVFVTPTQAQASHQSSSAVRTRRAAPFKAVVRREKKANVTMSFKRMLPPIHVPKPRFVQPRFQRTTSRLAQLAPTPVSLGSAHADPEHATAQGYELSHEDICAFVRHSRPTSEEIRSNTCLLSQFDGKTHEDLLQMLDDFSPDKYGAASLQPATSTGPDPNFAVPSSPQDRLHAYEYDRSSSCSRVMMLSPCVFVFRTMFSSPSSTLSFDSPWSASNSSASSSPVTPLFPTIDLEPSVQIQDLSYPAEWSFITRDVRSLDEVAAARLVSTAGVKKSYQSGSASIISSGELKKPHASVSTGTLRAAGLKLPGIGQPCIKSKA